MLAPLLRPAPDGWFKHLQRLAQSITRKRERQAPSRSGGEGIRITPAMESTAADTDSALVREDGTGNV
jgi:hypothetical protein